MLTTTIEYAAAAAAAACARAGARRRLDAGDVLAVAGTWGPIWRLDTGALRLDRDADGGSEDAMIALPGDLVGAEMLTAMPYHYTARALVACTLDSVGTVDEAQRQRLLAEAMLQSQRRADDVLALRSGPARRRVERLLAMLSGANPQHHTPPRLRLKDYAAFVGATQETTCRALAALRSNSAARCAPR